MAARHHPDLIMCRKQPGTGAGKLCERCEGKCVICDSYVRPHTAVRLCVECDFGALAGRCTICGGLGVSDAYYCKECVQQEKDVSGARAGARSAPCACALLDCAGPASTHAPHTHTRTHTHTHTRTRAAEGWLPQGHQSGHCQGRPALHNQKVWQGPLTPLGRDWRTVCCTLLERGCTEAGAAGSHSKLCRSAAARCCPTAQLSQPSLSKQAEPRSCTPAASAAPLNY